MERLREALKRKKTYIVGAAGIITAASLWLGVFTPEELEDRIESITEVIERSSSLVLLIISLLGVTLKAGLNRDSISKDE